MPVSIKVFTVRKALIAKSNAFRSDSSSIGDTKEMIGAVVSYVTEDTTAVLSSFPAKSKDSEIKIIRFLS